LEVLILKGLTLHKNCATWGRRGPTVEAVRRTALRASPGTETGMPNSCIGDGNGARKTHVVRRAFPLHKVGNYGPDKVGILRSP